MVDDNGTQGIEKYKQWHIAHELISNGINTICCTPVAYNEFSKKIIRLCSWAYKMKGYGALALLALTT
jgi:hypothetical protein